MIHQWAERTPTGPPVRQASISRWLHLLHYAFLKATDVITSAKEVM